MFYFRQYIVNGITFYRILAAPVLLYFIISNQPDVFKVLLPISFFTDAIDGYLARSLKVNTPFGAKIDSIGDDLTVLVAVIGIIVFRPAFLIEQLIYMAIPIILLIIQVGLAFIRYRRMSSFHTYSAKIAAVLQGIFLILFFLLDQPLYELFYLALICTSINLLEEIVLVVILPEWKSDIKGLYWILNKDR